MNPNAIANLKGARFKPGQSGNPGGKPVGSRNKLQGDFVRRLVDDFERFGIYAIARVRRHDPATYLRVVASLMPKQVEFKDPFDELSDEQLDAAYLAVQAVLAAQSPGEQASAQGNGAAASELPALPEAG